jgi:hypothetical protein
VAAGLSFSVLINKSVPHNGRDPAFEVGSFGKVVAVFIGFNGRFLHQVFCILAAAGQAESEGEKKVIKFMGVCCKFVISHGTCLEIIRSTTYSTSNSVPKS